MMSVAPPQPPRISQVVEQILSHPEYNNLSTDTKLGINLQIRYGNKQTDHDKLLTNKWLRDIWNYLFVGGPKNHEFF
jgi:hypothetical protein